MENRLAKPILISNARSMCSGIMPVGVTKSMEIPFQLVSNSIRLIYKLQENKNQ